MPKDDAAIGVYASSETDEYGLPIIRGRELGDDFSEADDFVAGADANGLQALMDYRAYRLTDCIAVVSGHGKPNGITRVIFPYPVAVGINPAQGVQNRIGLCDIVLVVEHL